MCVCLCIGCASIVIERYLNFLRKRKGRDRIQMQDGRKQYIYLLDRAKQLRLIGFELVSPRIYNCYNIYFL